MSGFQWVVLSLCCCTRMCVLCFTCAVCAKSVYCLLHTATWCPLYYTQCGAAELHTQIHIHSAAVAEAAGFETVVFWGFIQGLLYNKKQVGCL